jgi:hypothetical protein
MNRRLLNPIVQSRAHFAEVSRQFSPGMAEAIGNGLFLVLMIRVSLARK